MTKADPGLPVGCGEGLTLQGSGKMRFYQSLKMVRMFGGGGGGINGTWIEMKGTSKISAQIFVDISNCVFKVLSWIALLLFMIKTSRGQIILKMLVNITCAYLYQTDHLWTKNTRRRVSRASHEK